MGRTSFAQSLGRALREQREHFAHLTQEDVAHGAAITVRHYQKLEHGETDPGLDILLRVAEALNTTLQRLLDRADELHTAVQRKR